MGKFKPNSFPTNIPVHLVSGYVLVFATSSLRMCVILPLDFQAWIDSFSLLICILPRWLLFIANLFIAILAAKGRLSTVWAHCLMRQGDSDKEHG